MVIIMLKAYYILLFITTMAFAGSQATFPKNIKSMVLVKESVIPGKDVVLPKETPMFLQETVKMYNWINKGRGTKLNIFIPKNKLAQYKKHGPYSDGITAVAIYEDQDIVFVTEHIAGQPLYGVYDRKGKDISGSHPSLSIDTCYRCHDGYADICKNGTCAVPIIGAFK